MFNPRIEVVSLVKECCFNVDEIVRDIFQYILVINLLKNDNSNVDLISFLNIIEFKSVISLVAHLVKLI